jgi:farnesyl diphosphate synthase
MDGFEERLADCAARVEARLGERLSPGRLRHVPQRLADAMRHATLVGGKRLRPFLTLETSALFDVDAAAALETAIAIECLHCYSLVHDDLPAMDDDELRRGRPTVWKAFDEATAILAGDALLTLAFEILSGEEAHRDPAVRARLVSGLAVASGAAGMVGGQQLDLEAEAGIGSGLHSLDGVAAIQTRKTGALIRFAAEAGAILAGAAEPELHAIAAYGDALGSAFQIADDLLDAEGDEAATGKAVHKDASAGKATFVSVLGRTGARRQLAEMERRAMAALAPFGARADTLRAATSFVANRRR